jgi:metal-responsive CopG/Arc/MetJ family transcriptional regulator
VPLMLDLGSPRRVNVSLDYGLLQAIDAAARARGMTRSAFLSSAARKELAGG